MHLVQFSFDLEPAVGHGHWTTATAVQTLQAVNRRKPSKVNFHLTLGRIKRVAVGIRLEMKVAPAKGNINPSLNVTSAAPIGGSSPSVKVTLPVVPTEGKGNLLGEGQTSIQLTGSVARNNNNLEVPGQTKPNQFEVAGPTKLDQTNLPEKNRPSSAISQTSLQKSTISDIYQHPTPSRRSGGSL